MPKNLILAKSFHTLRNLRRTCHSAGDELEQISFSEGLHQCRRQSDTSDAGRTSKKRSMTDSESQSRNRRDNPVYRVRE